MKNMINLFDIGFTQKSAEDFFRLIKDSEINCLVDIRQNPNGQLSRFAFEKDLPYFLQELANGCAYCHRLDLAPSKQLLKEVRDKTSSMSKNYKLFESAFREQLALSSDISNFVQEFGKYNNIALLCSEATNEKCHRRVVCEVLIEMFPNNIKFGESL